MKLLGQLLGLVLGLLWVAFMVAVPVLAVWLASSLISFYGGPRELALIGGLLLFPVLPVAWELRATSQWKKKVASRKQLVGKPKRALSTLDRLVLRTLCLSLGFTAVLLVWFPQTAFQALATRGDWYLYERQEPWAQVLRKVSFSAATGLEWLHALANPNPYKKDGDELPPPSDVIPTPELPREKIARRWLPGTGPWRDAGAAFEPPDAGAVRVAQPSQDAGSADTPDPDEQLAGPPVPDATWSVGKTGWPWPNTPDQLLERMSRADEASIESVAHFVASARSDPFQRVKALHDWVVTRFAYELDSLPPNPRKPQDARSVFARRSGVCEGYARLLVELGKVTGDRIVYVTGDVREENGRAAPVGHAWNAVELRGEWYLMDATWDDPLTANREQIYRSDYLFIPPTIAVFDHFPDDRRWQLLREPLSRGDFLRQPFARPGLAREGLTLLAPNRPSVEVNDDLQVRLENPRRLHVMVRLAPVGGSTDVECGVDDAATISIRCPVETQGHYQANIFSNRERYGKYGSLASIDVTRL